jgi:hypothetical protein
MEESAIRTTRQPESPKRFFQVLRERAWYHHQLLAKGVTEAGFLVRRIVRHSVHPVWGLYLRRGTVLPGQEADTVKRTVSAVLGGLGVNCPRKEVEALTKGDRVEAFFIYPVGTPGSLTFYHGREEWLPEVMEPAQPAFQPGD